MKKFLVSFGFLLTTNFVHAEGMSDGNFWHGMCNSGDPSDYVACMAYINGVVQGVRNQAQLDKTSAGFCIPPKVTFQQIGDVFSKYLKDHPQERHKSSGFLAMISVYEAFPCK